MPTNARLSRRSLLKTSLAGATLATVGAASRPLAASPAMLQGQKLTLEYWQAFLEYGSIKEIIARFNAANPDVQVVSKVFNDYKELTQAIQAGAAAGQLPALAGIGFNYLRYAAANLPHLTISEAAARDTTGDGTAYLSEGFAPNLIALGQVDGVHHGMPFIIGTPYLSYNVDLFVEAGLDDRGPKTWEETRAFAKQIKDKTGRAGLYISQPNDFWSDQGLIESNGGQLLITDGATTTTGLDSPEAIAGLQFHADMVLKDQSALRLDLTQGEQSFNSGLVAMLVASADALVAPIKSGAFKLGTVPFPTFGDKRRKVPAGGNNLFILSPDEAQQRAAWEYIKFATAPDQIILVTQETGYPPLRLSLVDDPKYLKGFYDQNLLFKSEIEQFPDVVQWASWPGKNGLEIEQELLDYRAKILSGSQDVPTAAKATADTIDELLKA